MESAEDLKTYLLFASVPVPSSKHPHLGSAAASASFGTWRPCLLASLKGICRTRPALLKPLRPASRTPSRFWIMKNLILFPLFPEPEGRSAFTYLIILILCLFSWPSNLRNRFLSTHTLSMYLVRFLFFTGWRILMGFTWHSYPRAF